MKNFVSLILLLVFLQNILIPVGQAQQHSSPIKLELNEEDYQDIILQKNSSGIYEIKTTGNDPYLFTQKLDVALNADQHVLSFEYFSETGLNNIQLFFAPPVSESNSKMIAYLNPSEGWATFSVDLKEEMADWGVKGDFLRIDLGNIPGRMIQIRNIRLREPTERELEIAAQREEKKQFEAQLEKNLSAYLNKDYPHKLTEVQVASDKIVIRGELTSSIDSPVLGEVRLHDHVTELNDFEHTIKLDGEKGYFEVNIDRYVKQENETYDRLLSKWVIAEQNASGIQLMSHARYPDKIEPVWNLPEEKLKGRKGIGGFSAFRDAPVSDVDELGISSVTVNIWITNFMRSSASGSTISFEFNGKTFYVDRKQVERLDETLKTAADKDLVVSAIILIGQATDVPDKEIGKIFEHPDSDPAGIYSMANVTSPEGVEYYAAIMDFLAKRYNRPDARYGRIHHWIVHNEVDAGWVWTNAGDKTELVFMDLYHKSMRLIHNIARKYNSHSKTFISLTHYWNWTSNEKFYHSRDLLEILLDFSWAEGDFEWAIAHHPYPESLFEPKSWLDQKVDFTFDTPLITYKNIEVLDAWVKQPETFYKGKNRRTVFLSEQGLNSRDYSEKHLKEQAAGMAYAWKKIKPLDGIDAFQYHNWQDNRGEGGLRIGLRRFPDDKEAPGARKPIWHVYKYLNTPKEDSVCAFAKEMIGIDSWNQVHYRGIVGPNQQGRD